MDTVSISYDYYYYEKNLLIYYRIFVGGDNLVLNFVCPHFYLFNNDFMHILYDKCVLLKINIC